MRVRSAMLATAFAVAIGGGFGGAAQAAPLNGWYLGLEGGANWVEDWNNSVNGAPRIGTFDIGWLALATAGYAWNSHLRVEFEAGYRDNNIKNYTNLVGVPFAGTDGRLWEGTAMVNVLYDLPLTDNFTVSIGAGAGGDFANSELTTAGATTDDDQWNFAYQGIAGVSYSLTQRMALFANYHYLRVASPDFDYRPIIVAVQSGDDFVKHAATIGIRFALQPASTYSEVAAPPPPPPAAPSAAPRQFIVFFGFNKYNLTSEALRVIAEAVAAAKDTGSASVLVTGHTDTVGSNKYNERLSMRRSNAVKGEMVRQGIPTAAITATGKGETELLVQTADGVKEPQNRRSSIDLN